VLALEASCSGNADSVVEGYGSAERAARFEMRSLVAKLDQGGLPASEHLGGEFEAWCGRLGA